ncbi:MAG: tetratricopeptide repeat protein [Actinobacteria bacterium]|nr:tetratricopeptide repeat protein [Actinomycetota bacterium]
MRDTPLGDTSLVALGTLNLADLALIEGDFEDAALLSTETLRLSRELGDAESVAISLANGGVAAIKRGRLGQARELLGEALPIAKELGSPTGSLRDASVPLPPSQPALVNCMELPVSWAQLRN